jgi:hypothetical protein
MARGGSGWREEVADGERRQRMARRGQRLGEIQTWIGLDVGKADHHATVIDAAGALGAPAATTEPGWDIAVAIP